MKKTVENDGLYCSGKYFGNDIFTINGDGSFEWREEDNKKIVTNTIMKLKLDFDKKQILMFRMINFEKIEKKFKLVRSDCRYRKILTFAQK